MGRWPATQMAGQALSGIANTLVGSAFGDEVGGMFSSALAGAASGAAMGSIIPVIGPALGAAIGGGIGLLQGGTQIFEQRDEAFKGYVQEQTEGVLEERGQDITAGSATAAQREQDVNAFNRLLGEGVGDEYLADLRTLAAATPMEYGDLTTMSRSLAIGFKEDPGRMLELMTAIGDAGSAVGVDTSGMNTMATAMSRMQASGKVSLEYVNLMAQGTDEGYAEAGRMLMEAKVKGMNEYNASTGAQLALKSELALAAGIRDDTRTNEAFYDAGYRKAQEFSIGLADGMAGAFERAQELGDRLYSDLGPSGRGGTGQPYDSGRASGKNSAYGLERVPYDGYPAILHEDERVLTAQEARQADRERTEEALGYAYGLERVPRDGYPAVLHEDERVLTAQEARQTGRGDGAPAVQVTVTGNTFYGSDEAMEERVARKVGREVQRAILLAQP